MEQVLLTKKSDDAPSWRRGGARARAGDEGRIADGPIKLAAIGLEAEFAVVIDGEQVKPEDVFGSPANIVRAPMMHRTGRSYHLPTGGAVYFDTGVIEVATPVIEIEPGCAARAVRSLWEGILFLREELDAWERKHGKEVELVGFSAHYNVSFDVPEHAQRDDRSVKALALLLSYVLPMPVMLLAANRRSTGVGVRPRGDRLEVTVDFTPDPRLMTAAATVIVGIVREIMSWPSYALSQLAEHEIPVVKGFAPVKHTSRKGWLARYTCYPENPFACNVDAPIWSTRVAGSPLSLREIAARTVVRFWDSIERIGLPRTLRLIADVLRGRADSLLELDDRPPSYEQVGRLRSLGGLYSERDLPRSRYERVLMQAIGGHRLRVGGLWLTPVGMRGWSHVVFRRDGDGGRQVMSLDQLLGHLSRWHRSRTASVAKRPARKSARKRTRTRTQVRTAKRVAPAPENVAPVLDRVSVADTEMPTAPVVAAPRTSIEVAIPLVAELADIPVREESVTPRAAAGREVPEPITQSEVASVTPARVTPIRNEAMPPRPATHTSRTTDTERVEPTVSGSAPAVAAPSVEPRAKSPRPRARTGREKEKPAAKSASKAAAKPRRDSKSATGAKSRATAKSARRNAGSASASKSGAKPASKQAKSASTSSTKTAGTSKKSRGPARKATSKAPTRPKAATAKPRAAKKRSAAKKGGSSGKRGAGKDTPEQPVRRLAGTARSWPTIDNVGPSPDAR